jgi:hypothetical protein
MPMNNETWTAAAEQVRGFWDLLTSRTEGACLNPDNWSPNSTIEEGSAAGTLVGDGGLDVVTFAVRCVIVGTVTFVFVSWQLAHMDDPPVTPFIADLEHENKRVKCIGLNLVHPNVSFFGIRLPLPLMPDRPCEFVNTGMWQGLVFTWPYQPRYFEPLLTHVSRQTISLVTLAMQIFLFAILGGCGAVLARVPGTTRAASWGVVSLSSSACHRCDSGAL